MLFSAPHFFVFFALYYLAHRYLEPANRLWLVIIGGTIFYAWWIPAYVFIPHILMLFAFWSARFIADGRQIDKGKLIFIVILLLIPLGFFKYTNFFVNQVIGLTSEAGRKIVDLPLPLGISFVTFTLIAYVVDVWRHKYPMERRLPMLASYVIFFPHLIAGPILRPHELLPQLERPKDFRVLPGILIFTVGLAKKLVLADQIAMAVDPVYADPLNANGWTQILAIYGFSAQIYCDFSGYTDMAIGLAILLGVRLPNNFRQPYTAYSIVDFWRRWHITLSSWLRDYLYIPLGGNRFGATRRTIAVLVTMLLGGLWHGANWTFIVWGAIHGSAVALAHWLGPMRRHVPNWLGILFTFHVVTIAWVFFRAPNIDVAVTMLVAPFFGKKSIFASDWTTLLTGNLFPAVLIAFAFLVHKIDDHRRLRYAIRHYPTWVILAVIAFLWLISITLSTGSSAAFIYYDF